eukprot:Ihof_evm2s706 gene=Ihof_evmTU2s706
MIPGRNIQNQETVKAYQLGQKEWMREGYVLFNQTTVRASASENMLDSFDFTLVNQSHRTESYTDAYFNGSVKFFLPEDFLTSSANQPVSLGSPIRPINAYFKLTYTNHTSQLTLPLDLVTIKILNQTTTEEECGKVDGLWVNNSCLQYQRLVRACPTVTMVDNDWAWVDTTDNWKYACQAGPYGEAPVKEIYKPLTMGKGGRTTMTLDIELRHFKDPHFLAITLPFNLTL